MRRKVPLGKTGPTFALWQLDERGMAPGGEELAGRAEEAARRAGRAAWRDFLPATSD